MGSVLTRLTEAPHACCVQERAARYYDKAVIWKALRGGAPLASLRLNRPLRWACSKEGSGIDAAKGAWDPSVVCCALNRSGRWLFERVWSVADWPMHEQLPRWAQRQGRQRHFTAVA